MLKEFLNFRKNCVIHIPLLGDGCGNGRRLPGAACWYQRDKYRPVSQRMVAVPFDLSDVYLKYQLRDLPFF